MTEENKFSFLRKNYREEKPRTSGITEIRGPYYTPVGPNYLDDVFSTMGEYVDSLKFSGGSFSMMPDNVVREMIAKAHTYDIEVSTGGFIEYVLIQGPEAVESYLEACKSLGFDTIELSCGFISIPTDDWSRLIERVMKMGMKPKPELGIQFGAGGDTAAKILKEEGTQDVGWVIHQAKRFLDQGVPQLMIESEGITENVQEWRVDVIARLIDELGLDKLMFEAADPKVFAWYIKNYGPEVNLFVDHSQIVQLEALRQGIWGTKSMWGRILSYNPHPIKRIEYTADRDQARV
ncbi:MAG: phosphosulfolactate synthase [Candidatus Obscuribacterales bacterium]|nr:phosphosulfolactate synthase [Candidatus Obscuribacterales bacterium]